MNEKMTGIEVRVYGDSIGQLESTALEKARGFFGENATLAVTPNYTAHEQSMIGGVYLERGRYYADIRVVQT